MLGQLAGQVSTQLVTVDSALSSSGTSRSYVRTTFWASCQVIASVSSRTLGSMPSRSACSATSRPAYAWYVATVGSPASAGSPAGPPAPRNARSWASRTRIRAASSPAALVVNVRPRIWSGRTSSLATSQSTRADIVSVLPEPAPATTTAGPSGAPITAACSAVGAGSRSATANSAGDHRGGFTR